MAGLRLAGRGLLELQAFDWVGGKAPAQSDN